MVSTKSSKKVPLKISVPRASSVSRVQTPAVSENHSSSYQSPLYPTSSTNFSLPAHANEAVVSASPKAGKHHFLIALIFILAVVGISLFLFFAKNIGTGQAYHGVANTIGLVPVDDPANVGAKSFDLTVNLGQIETVAFHFELALPAGVDCNRVIVSSFGNLADLEDKVCNGQTLSYDVAVADYSLAKTGDTSLAFLIIPNPAAGTYVLAPTNVDVIDLNTGDSVVLTVESFDLVIAEPRLDQRFCSSIAAPSTSLGNVRGASVCADRAFDVSLSAQADLALFAGGYDCLSVYHGVPITKGTFTNICTHQNPIMYLTTENGHLVSRDRWQSLCLGYIFRNQNKWINMACDAQRQVDQNNPSYSPMTLAEAQNCIDYALAYSSMDSHDSDFVSIVDYRPEFIPITFQSQYASTLPVMSAQCAAEHVDVMSLYDADEDGLANDADRTACHDNARLENGLCVCVQGFRNDDATFVNGCEGAVDVIIDPDADLDTVIDVNDNCPAAANEDQNDVDEDDLGDVCDDNPDDGPVGDSDGDGVVNEEDICPDVANPEQDNICDRDDNRLPGDSDGDNIIDVNDNCPAVANVGQLNTDGDAQGDVCDVDDDNDGVVDVDDACPLDETNVCDDLNQDDADPQEAVACQENGCGVEGQYICAEINGVAISQHCESREGCLTLIGVGCNQENELTCVADERRCVADNPVVDNAGEEGVVCTVDADCNAPLSCVAGVCGVAPVDLNGPGDGINPLDDNVPGDNPPLSDNDLYDVNLDQCIGLKDISILGANLDIAHSGDQKVFAQGDLNADGFVDLIDVFLLTRHINWECEEQ